jgi:hypothetical protein
MSTTKSGTTTIKAVEAPLKFADVFEFEEMAGLPRLRIGAHRPAETALLLANSIKPPFYLLYVLLTNRCDRKPGRYQSPPIASVAELRPVITRFAKFLDNDARHHLWIAQVNGSAAVVDDRHGIVFAYGDVQTYVRAIGLHGFSPGTVRLPGNHTHKIDPAFDDDERALFDLWAWQRAPLKEGDDD